MSPIDFGRHSDDYARLRPGFPTSFYRRIEGIVPLQGRRALDLATGPGTVALELAARGSTVVGIDLSPGQVAAARRVARERGLERRARFLVGRAEEAGLRSSAFDLVTAGQCWHWLDGPAVLAEVRRVLEPGGWLVIAHFSYLAEHSAVARETEELILRFNPTWTMAGCTGTYPELIDDVIRGGFDLVEQFCYQHEQEFSHEAWRGRIRTCNGVGSGGLEPADVVRFDEALARLLRERHPDPVPITHRIWCVVARKPS